MIYLTITLKPWERVNWKLVGLLPRRNTKTKRAPPTILTVEEDEKYERWWYPTPLGMITREQKTQIMAAVLAIMVKATFQTHIYECEGEIYQQVEGCPTGLRPSGPISRLFMDKWVRELRRIEAESKELHRINPVTFCEMDIKLIKKYVDDVLFGGDEVAQGALWKNRCLQWSQEQLERDKASGEDHNSRTMRIIAMISSEILECLTFTWDSPSQNKSNMMPVLDTQVWVEVEARVKGIPKTMGEAPEKLKPDKLKKIIMFQFYKKPMANKCPNLQKSGIPEGSKRATASQEILRRLKNTSRELEPSIINNVLQDYMGELAMGGYPVD